jgi:hypothetical protein
MEHRPEHGQDRTRVSPTAPESQSLSAAVWGYLESIPGFTDDLREAEADLEAGRGVPFRDDDRLDRPQPAR